LRPKRRLLLPFALLVTSLVIIGARKIFDYAAGPDRDKESDYIFPPSSGDTKPTTIQVSPKSLPIVFYQKGGFINDASHLNKTGIFGIVRPASEQDIRDALQYARENNLKVTCAGQQHSMGGQTFSSGGLVLDLRNFNRITLDQSHKTINVQSGARWWQIQKLLDQRGLGVKSMQSINIFSVGGTLSVNAHGIDPSPGPIAPSVRSMRIMLAEGRVVRASPTENRELFRHALGGYGLFGVILDADLDLVANEMYERETLYMSYRDYPAYYAAHVENNDRVGLVFARLSVAPQSFLQETAVHTYLKTSFEGTLPPLRAVRHDALDRFIINLSKTGALGRWIRWTLEKYAEPHLHDCLSRNQAMNQKELCLVTRNEEMYDDMAYLKNRLRDTDILQEYFIPCAHMPEFVDGLRHTVRAHGANLLNVTIRTVHRDDVTALPYAAQEMFGFVLYFNVKFNDRDNAVLRQTTRDLVDVAEKAGGTYYLPYQLFYSPEQLRRAYPNIDQFFATKRKYDPAELFSNRFYESYAR